jgi:predicted component of type VI protein secretion system
MALTKEIVVDKIEVLEMGQVQVRTATRVLEDGTVLSSSFHRHVLSPGDDLTDQDPKVSAIATATWTAEVVAAYEAQMAAQEADTNTA